MKLILTDDVPHLGSMGDTVAVKPGYGRNYLIPRGLAILATAGSVNRMEHEKRGIEAKAARLRQDSEKLAKKIEKLKIQFARAAGEEDRLFGSVTSQDIQAYLFDQGIEIDRKYIHLGDPIKSLGVFEVEIKLHPTITTKVSVWVVKE
ncbi:MAG: 50S ribosomal protein L9 [Myxococcales bacterium]|nr:50S ribosomal protein L9 [Myxococcales bacterium]